MYRSYFENQNGEQALFLYDYEQERGTLYMGDAGWEHPHDVVDGKVADLMLNRPEQLWLSACWEASGALKAVHEQIREERERLARLVASDKPASEMVIEDRGPY